jgi:heat shock protein HslJ
MRRSRWMMLSLGVLALASLLAGCRASLKVGGAGGPPDLVGTEWELNTLDGRHLIDDSYIHLFLDDKYLGGSMTCNNYGGGPDSGRYRAADDGSFAIVPGVFAVTVQLCSSPPGIMQQEEAYIEALLGASAYQVERDRLEVKDVGGRTTLVFTRRE